LALAFRQRFPGNFSAYARACRLGELKPGGILTHALEPMERPVDLRARWIVNLATKDHWRNPSRLEWVSAGSQRLRQWCDEVGAKTVAVPALGAGLGGLEWPAVRAEILRAFAGSGVRLLLYPPQELPSSRPGKGPSP
jgi:O-acetyl-ADP-ribose deacetylase (regulator of RNase III)